MRGNVQDALNLTRPVSGELSLVETGRPHHSTRDRLLVLSKFPPTGAGTIGGRLGAIDVDGEMFLLQLHLEVFWWQVPPGSQAILPGLVSFGPRIGGVNISEGIGSIIM